MTAVRSSLVHEDEVKSIIKDFNLKFGTFLLKRLDIDGNSSSEGTDQRAERQVHEEQSSEDEAGAQESIP